MAGPEPTTGPTTGPGTDPDPAVDAETAPLTGLRVVDFTHLVAGPFCTMMLSDAGATVFKIEPPWGDSSRLRGARRDGPGGRHVSGYLVATNRGKRSVVLDVKSEAGRRMALDLIETADVMIENFAPGVLDRLGFGPAAMRARFPRLITASISLFGAMEDDSIPERSGLAIVAEAESSLADRVRDANGVPVPLNFPLGDIASGLTAFSGILTALLARGVTGRGRHVDVSMVRTLFAFNATAVAGHALAGEAERGIRTAPYGYYPSADGYVAVACNVDPLWVRLCHAIGRPDLAVHPDFAHYTARDPRVEEVDAIVVGWTKSRTSAEIVDILARAGVPCGAINTIGDVLAQPLYRQAGIFTEVDDGMGGTAVVPRNPLGYDRPAVAIPQMGQHTVEVFTSLGYTGAQLAEALAAGAFGEAADAVAAQLAEGAR
jgi:crotonobetainyl-CoA:carnitine CoA-transferase CaiB-like acyl-CoA transferase